MIKLLLIEDEPSALRRLKRMVMELRPSWKIVNTADSVESAIKVINQQDYDLILTDIQLSDGTCFDVFSSTDVNTPVIFITAFDEYAIKAFEFNSIHYLLKPIKPEQLHQALEKFEENQLRSFEEQSPLFSEDRTFQQKILSKVGGTTAVINPEDIAIINHANKITTALLFNGKKHYLEQSLDKLEEYLSENLFFRISRQSIVNKNSVVKYNTVSSSRVALITLPDFPEELIVSKEKTPFFKRWMAKESE